MAVATTLPEPLGEPVFFRMIRSWRHFTPTHPDQTVYNTTLRVDHETKYVLAKMTAQEKMMHGASTAIQKQNAIINWDSVKNDNEIKQNSRRLFIDINGWVVPGSMIALMVNFLYPCRSAWNVFGPSLELARQIYADRLRIIVGSGWILVDDRLRDTIF